MRHTGSCSADLGRLRDWIADSDRVLVGAGAGLSTAAGMVLDGERYERNFADFIGRYHDPNMYVAGFRRYGSLEEKWAYWSRAIMLDRYEFEDNGTYAGLLDLLRDRDYFVLTTNVDHCFQRFGFDKRRLFYTQGDYGLWQCSRPCCQRTYDNEGVVRRMCREQRGMRVPSELVPRCPRCGSPMTMNLRTDDTFVQDRGWYEAAGRYREFAESAMRGRTLYLELGVGYNTPGIIKYPFWRMAADNRRSRYVSISLGTCQVPDGLAGRSLGLDMDIRTALESVSRGPERRSANDKTEGSTAAVKRHGSSRRPASCSPTPSPPGRPARDIGSSRAPISCTRPWEGPQGRPPWSRAPSPPWSGASQSGPSGICRSGTSAVR